FWEISPHHLSWDLSLTTAPCRLPSFPPWSRASFQAWSFSTACASHRPLLSTRMPFRPRSVSNDAAKSPGTLVLLDGWVLCRRSMALASDRGRLRPAQDRRHAQA